jgi:tRNA (guanosine-2'-O-)-methyltransferase
MTAERFHKLRKVLTQRQPDLTVLMDRVHKIHNFSAILRNCDATGVLEAHLVPPEEGVRLSHATSAGSKKWVRVRRHPDARTAIFALQKRGYRVLAAHPADGARDFRELDLTRPTAFILGSELEGVSREALDHADEAIFIPMMGMVQSLNVSVASATLLFEAMRQRQNAGMYSASRLSPERFQRILFEWAYPRIAGRCRSLGLPYPRLDENGEFLDPVPGTQALPGGSEY